MIKSISLAVYDRPKQVGDRAPTYGAITVVFETAAQDAVIRREILSEDGPKSEEEALAFILPYVRWKQEHTPEQARAYHRKKTYTPIDAPYSWARGD